MSTPAPASSTPLRRHAAAQISAGTRAGAVWPWLLLLIVAAGAAAWWMLRSHHAAAAAAGAQAHDKPRDKAVPVVAATAVTDDLPIYLTGLGTVTPFATVTVRSRVDGQLVTVAFSEGQVVQAGDLLAEVDARPFAAQLKQAEGQLVKDQALLANAKLDLERYRSATEVFTKQQVDTQASTVAQFEGTVTTDQGVVDNARLQLGYCRITAPIGGVIGLRSVDAGNLIHATDQGGIAVITALQPIAVLFSIAQDDIPQVVKRMHGGPALEVDAYSRDLAARLATGTLAAIDNQVDAGSGTVRLKASFPNQDHALYPNQFVNARLLVDTRHGVVLVPAAAVQRAPDQNYVFVVKQDDSTVEVRHVTVGPSEAGRTIVDGVSAGDVVVVDGVDKLQAGFKVSVKQPGHEGGGHGTAKIASGDGDAPAATEAGAGAGAAPAAGAEGGKHHHDHQKDQGAAP